MDQSENRQKDGISGEEISGSNSESRSYSETDSRPEEDTGSVKSVKAKWTHGSDLNFEKIRPTLEFLKIQVENSIKGHKDEIERLQKTISKFGGLKRLVYLGYSKFQFFSTQQAKTSG